MPQKRYAPKPLFIAVNKTLFTFSLTTIGLLAGCRKEEVARAPEPPVHNAMTDYVENRVTAMHKAESVAQITNTQNQKTDQQAQGVQEP
jgi:hypothetical protein